MQLSLEALYFHDPWVLPKPLAFESSFAIVFIQQGLSKFPVTSEDAEAYGLPYLVWWIVSYGELGAALAF